MNIKSFILGMMMNGGKGGSGGSNKTDGTITFAPNSTIVRVNEGVLLEKPEKLTFNIIYTTETQETEGNQVQTPDKEKLPTDTFHTGGMTPISWTDKAGFSEKFITYMYSDKERTGFSEKFNTYMYSDKEKLGFSEKFITKINR